MPRISSGVQIRNGIIFINKMLNGKYHRFSTGLESNKNNLRYVRKNIMQIIADKERETQDNVSGANFREKMRTQKNAKKIDFSIHQLADDGFSVDKCDFKLKQAIALLAKEWTGLKPTSKAIYESISKQLLIYFGADCLVVNINRMKIADFFNYCLEKKYKKSFINLKFGILKRVLVLAEEYGVIDKVPNLRFKMPMETEMTQKVKAFSEDEVRLLLNSCKNQVLRNYLQIAFFTGCRTGEILALKWSDVDFKAVNAQKYGGVSSVTSTTLAAFKIFDDADDFVCGKNFTAVLKGKTISVCRELIVGNGFVEIYTAPTKPKTETTESTETTETTEQTTQTGGNA